jgi:hypothetical protein
VTDTMASVVVLATPSSNWIQLLRYRQSISGMLIGGYHSGAGC